MKIKHLLFSPLVAGIILSSCQKEISNSVQPRFDNFKLTADSARTEFSKILSKAIYNEPELRKFIKMKALEEFDLDYDVFYPFVKNEVVSEGKSFRQILQKYSDNEDQLATIEETLPLLNILVPDLTAFCKFSAEKWNINDREVAVTALNRNNDPHVFYGNGERMFSLENDEIPGFPVLVVKNSERIKQKDGLKVKGMGGSHSYEFVDDAFDKRLKTKATPATSVENAENIIGAWNEFGVDPQYWQRDYIYYGMSHSNSKNAQLNPQIREHIEMIKFEPSILYTISDQTGDPFLKNEHEHKSDDKNPLSYEQISRALWTEGNFEFRIYVSKGKRDGSTTTSQTFVMNVHPTEIFRFKKIKHVIKSGGWFHRDRHTYSLESTNDIESKWYFPYNGGGFALEKWDISQEAMNLNFQIFERDDSETIEKSYSYKNTYANSTNFKIDVGLGGIIEKIVKLDLGFGFSSNKSTEKTESTKIVTTKTSDDLGNLTLYFSDPILRTNSSQKKIDDSPWFFPDAYTISNGAVTMQILPKKL